MLLNVETRRETVFFNYEDRICYLIWLKEYSERRNIEILAYCLMTDHVHLVAVPSTGESLHKVLRPLHMRYVQRINREHRWAHKGLLASRLIFKIFF